MTKRNYTSTVRADVAAEKRGNTLQAAARFFREGAPVGTFSLDAVAKAAGVTRLTVYNQFGSRGGLLDAVFEELARKGGILGLAEVKNSPSASQAFDLLIEIFCRFWGSDAALVRLYEAMSIDPEIAQALAERMERGRHVIASVVERLAPGADGAAKRDAADMIFALTGLPTYRVLAASRSAGEVCELIKLSCAEVSRRILRV